VLFELKFIKDMELKNKKVLLVGLGVLGGGLSMAEYFLKKGADLTITDLRTKKELKKTISKLPSKVKYTLGKHTKKDFENAELIMFNQAVPATSKWIKLATELKKQYFNDYIYFLENLKKINPNVIIIGVTGTRGKTTISTWINNLIPGSVLAGNIPENNFLKQLEKKTDVFVLELSSYQLEHVQKNTPASNIAIITNVYVDHLNRYGNLKKYKDVKFNIFRNQTKKDVLVLDFNEPIRKEVQKQKPLGQIYYVSNKKLPKNVSGMFFSGNDIYFQNPVGHVKVAKKENLAPHEKTNLLFSMLAAHLAGIKGKDISKNIEPLTNPKMRQELVFKNKKFEVYNDSSGTSPDATIAAIEKFKERNNLVLITGGTDKELNFEKLADKISKILNPKISFCLKVQQQINLSKN